MGGCSAKVPVKYVEGLFYRMPDDYLLEEFESAISVCVVREESDGGVAAVCLSEDVEKIGREEYIRPREDGDERNADDEGVLDSKSHQEGSDNAAAENCNPELLPLVQTSVQKHIQLTLGLVMIPSWHMPFTSCIS